MNDQRQKERRRTSIHGPQTAPQRGIRHSRMKKHNPVLYWVYPNQKHPWSARDRTGMDGALVEGLVSLGLLELHNKRRDGAQVLDHRRRSPRADGFRLERLGCCDSSGVRDNLFLFLWRWLR